MSFIWQADLHDEEPPGSLRAATLGTDQLDPRQAVAGERPASLYLSQPGAGWTLSISLSSSGKTQLVSSI